MPRREDILDIARGGFGSAGAGNATADRDDAPEQLVHRSIYVKGELHLGPLNECRHCRPNRRTR